MLTLEDCLDLLACPRCRSALRTTGEELTCAQGHRFPVVHGVPDLRLQDPPYHTRSEERRVVERLVERSETLSYAELVTDYYAGADSEGYTECSEVGVRWALNVEQRGREYLALVDEFLGLSGWGPRQGAALELGCGGGGTLEALARSHPRVLGLNISLAELMLARAYLRCHGLENVLLVAASGEQLPFATGRLGFVLLEDVIEHLADQQAALQEIVRCLEPGGLAHLNSPNRYALLGPEGHVKLMWLGFLPRPLMSPYVRLRTGRPYHAIRLLGQRELAGMLARLQPEATSLIFTPELRARASSLAGKLYRLVARGLPGTARALYLALQPEHRVLIRRAGSRTGDGV